MKKVTRCAWVPPDDPLYQNYHDEEWGVPVHDDRILFEFLILEGAQAGLSWSTILKRRQGYRKAFAQFYPAKVAAFDQNKVEELMQDPGIIRNRRKIEAAIQNAHSFLQIQKQFGSFDNYLWAFVSGKPIHNHWKSIKEVPPTNDVAKLVSKDLLKRGFKFVGPTIIYAYMQAIGMVNDHTIDCFKHYTKRSAT